MDSKSELVKNWLIKSQHDLLAAQKLSGEPEIYADVAIYHCQQSAEWSSLPRWSRPISPGGHSGSDQQGEAASV